jgi:hypothetical protein
MPHRSDAQYLEAQLKPYVGWTLVEVVAARDPALGDDVLALLLQHPGGKRQVMLTAMRDPEGNGPGWLDITPVDQ